MEGRRNRSTNLLILLSYMLKQSLRTPRLCVRKNTPRDLQKADETELHDDDGVWAPTIRYNDGTYYLVFTFHGQKSRNYLTTAKDPAGPWTPPVHVSEADGGITLDGLGIGKVSAADVVALWPDGQMPDRQAEQAEPFLAWHTPRERTSDVCIIAALVGRGVAVARQTPAAALAELRSRVSANATHVGRVGWCRIW